MDNELDLYDYIENPEEAPFSVFESKKVFIGKRHHQTEKPQDILEFFLKYWTDENDTVLDPTMGSGSTGVACQKLKRKFIGFELDEKIFKTAQKRIEEKK
jgi:site-specific DNA-methyltransferase (adenine-specific)